MFNRKYIFKGPIFHCYVSLPECKATWMFFWTNSEELGVLVRFSVGVAFSKNRPSPLSSSTSWWRLLAPGRRHAVVKDWLALPVGNEGPSTFTLVYWGFMNPHSLRVGPAGFLRIFYGSPSTSFLQICIVRVYHYVKGSTIFSQCWQRPPGILFAITCPSSKKSQSFLMQLLLQVVRCCLKQIALCYHPTAAICRPTN